MMMIPSSHIETQSERLSLSGFPETANPIDFSSSSSPSSSSRSHLAYFHEVLLTLFLEFPISVSSCHAFSRDKTSTLHALVEVLGMRANLDQTSSDAAILSLVAKVAPMEIWRQPALIQTILASFLIRNAHWQPMVHML